MTGALKQLASAAASTIYDAINAARSPDDLDHVCRLLWRGYADGVIGDDDSNYLQSCIDRRRPPGRYSPIGHLKSVAGPLAPLVRRLGGRFQPRQRPRCPNRKASRDRRRTLGGSSVLPADLRCHYTEGQRSVLAIIAGEVKHHGQCDMPVDKIGALAGVCRTTVQTTLFLAKAASHIHVSERPVPGRKHLTNVITITSGEWMDWLKRGPTAHRPIGSNSLKMVSTTKNIVDDQGDGDERTRRLQTGERQQGGPPSRKVIELANELATIAGHKAGALPKSWTDADAPGAVMTMLTMVAAFATNPAHTPLQTLRTLLIHIASRRAAVGDPPRSPRYFVMALDRWSEELKRSLARPLPTGGGSRLSA